MRPLLIDKTVIAEINGLIEYAETCPFSMDDLLDIKNGDMPCAGDRPEFTMKIPYGYRAVYSIELQPAGKVRHLSLSVDAKKSLPHMKAVEELMKLFGFTNDLFNCAVGVELLDDEKAAIQIAEIIKQP